MFSDFQPITQHYKWRTAWKHWSLQLIQPLRKIWNAWSLGHAFQLSIKNSGCAARLCCITTLCFQLLRTLWVTFQAKNCVKSAPASFALVLCPAGPMLIAQTPSVDISSFFLGPEVQSSQNIGWPIRIKGLCNRFKTPPKHLKMSDNTEKGNILEAIYHISSISFE